jgi:hypothetical protein
MPNFHMIHCVESSTRERLPKLTELRSWGCNAITAAQADGISVLCRTRLVPANTPLSTGSWCFQGNCSSGAAMVRMVGATNVTMRGVNVTGSSGAGDSLKR